MGMARQGLETEAWTRGTAVVDGGPKGLMFCGVFIGGGPLPIGRGVVDGRLCGMGLIGRAALAAVVGDAETWLVDPARDAAEVENERQNYRR